MRIGRIAPLAFVLVWFYLFIALLANPAFTSPSTIANPVAPFLSADAIGMLWPIILLLTPIVVVSVQRLIMPSGAARRQVSPQEFARIQARAHATSESIREGVRREELPGLPRATAEVAPPTKLTKPVEREFPKPNGSETSETKAKEGAGKSEFTPPPTTLREAVFGKTATDSRAEEASVVGPSAKETAGEATDETAGIEQRIEELEAEKSAVSSLKTRLEEMKSSGTIEQELYEKLNKKYTSEIDRIDDKMEKLVRKEKKKVPKK